MRAAALLLGLMIAAVGGLLTSELLYRSTAFRDAVGQLTRGTAAHDPRVLVEMNLRRAAAGIAVSDAEIDRELHLLQFQFANEKAFQEALAREGMTESELRDRVAEPLRGRAWIEQQIAPQLAVSEEVCRSYFEENREQFLQPPRFRVRHLFLVAPEGSPAEVVEQKRKGSNALAARAAKGESLAALAAEASEDLHTKPRGGDLGYFSAARMPEDFMAEVGKLSLGKTSGVVQTRLGFHILELMEMKPETPLGFEQVREEIATGLRNERRTAAVVQLSLQLQVEEFIRRRR